MTKEEAQVEQGRIKMTGYDLGWWFGTECRKCCGVYPRFHDGGGTSRESCWYECDVCGKRTKKCVMPHVAVEAWNRGEFEEVQIRFC